jgi:hypothetical protein
LTHLLYDVKQKFLSLEKQKKSNNNSTTNFLKKVKGKVSLDISLSENKYKEVNSSIKVDWIDPREIDSDNIYVQDIIDAIKNYKKT